MELNKNLRRKPFDTNKKVKMARKMFFRMQRRDEFKLTFRSPKYFASSEPESDTEKMYKTILHNS